MGHIYPVIKPFASQMISVSNGHDVYLEQSGNLKGIPVLFLHGGPGAGLSPLYRRFFDPNLFHIIGFDQRGCGRSTPFASMQNNTTEDLLEDIEQIRQHLGINKWMLLGGSWGSTLALLNAIRRPQTVLSIVLRGVFLARQQDLDWFIQGDGGAAQVFPEHYQEFIDVIKDKLPEKSIVDSFYNIFVNGDELTRAHAAKNWCMWEERISLMNSSVQEQDLCQNLNRAASLAALECHYIKHKCFIEEDYILNNIHKLKNIPGTIIHGRYDMVCKLENAYALSKKWREGQLLIVPEAAHSASDPNICDAICHATDAMAKFLKEREQ
ncbi:MAG: prolyl aminopeptidase [Aliiglaciecola sp.]|uniref:prolyl aminopeptidase n=1 Tax=Aliiglaciecola sp. M165 TaxID=2593649 RepID=UPI0011806006|nr:prolyl aminopeptidase [Aliiglaciecola sp. M165]TRY29086.1 prolyl aminopeptidase [Aliiglaciecola sp. M165]